MWSSSILYFFCLITVYSECLVAQLGPTLCISMDCKPPSSSVYGILQARILEWVAVSFSRESSWPRVWTQVSCIAGKFSATRKVNMWQAFHNSQWTEWQDQILQEALPNVCSPAFSLLYCRCSGEVGPPQSFNKMSSALLSQLVQNLLKHSWLCKQENSSKIS